MLETKASTLEDGSDRIVASIPFNSKRKKASTAIILPGNEQYVRIFVKGAPDFMLDICSNYLGQNGNSYHLSHEKQ